LSKQKGNAKQYAKRQTKARHHKNSIRPRRERQDDFEPQKSGESKGKAPEKYRTQNDINLHISEARKRKLERGFWGSGRKQEVAQQPGDKEVGGRQPATR